MDNRSSDAHVGALESAEQGVVFAGRLHAARSAQEAVDVAVGFIHERIDAPVIGLRGSPDGSGGYVVQATRGMSEGAPRRSGIPASVESIEALRDLGTDVFGRSCVVSDAGPVALIVGTSAPEAGALVRGVIRLLRHEVERDDRRAAVDLPLAAAVAAHEIRGPLLASAAALESAQLDTNIRSVESRQTVTDAGREMRRLAGMVEGLIEIAAATNAVRTAPADLRTIVAEAAVVAEKEGHTGRVAFACPTAPMWLDVNEFQVQVAATNLIRNALAYSEPDSEVRVSLDREADGVVILVENDGLDGVEEGERSIFEPFTRGRSAGDTPGSGLGLFIVRRVVELHHGSLTRTSEGGRISFAMRFPSDVARGQPCAS